MINDRSQPAAQPEQENKRDLQPPINPFPISTAIDQYSFLAFTVQYAAEKTAQATLVIADAAQKGGEVFISSAFTAKGKLALLNREINKHYQPCLSLNGEALLREKVVAIDAKEWEIIKKAYEQEKETKQYNLFLFKSHYGHTSPKTDAIINEAGLSTNPAERAKIILDYILSKDGEGTDFRKVVLKRFETTYPTVDRVDENKGNGPPSPRR